MTDTPTADAAAADVPSDFEPVPEPTPFFAVKYSAVTDLRYSNPEQTRIDATVTIDGLGPVPFTCCPDDVEPHAIDIYARALAGEFGEIAAYAEPVYSADYLAAKGRSWRDAEIVASQWIVDRHRDQVADGMTTTLTTDQYKALQVYRQALRDWPASAGFPAEASRPAVPDWLIAAENEAE